MFPCLLPSTRLRRPGRFLHRRPPPSVIELKMGSRSCSRSRSCKRFSTDPSKMPPRRSASAQLFLKIVSLLRRGSDSAWSAPYRPTWAAVSGLVTLLLTRPWHSSQNRLTPTRAPFCPSEYSVCRRLGVQRWPYRQLRSLNTKLALLRDDAAAEPAGSVAQMRLLQEIAEVDMKRRNLVENPNLLVGGERGKWGSRAKRVVVGATAMPPGYPFRESGAAPAGAMNGAPAGAQAGAPPAAPAAGAHVGGMPMHAMGAPMPGGLPHAAMGGAGAGAAAGHAPPGYPYFHGAGAPFVPPHFSGVAGMPPNAAYPAMMGPTPWGFTGPVSVPPHMPPVSMGMPTQMQAAGGPAHPSYGYPFNGASVTAAASGSRSMTSGIYSRMPDFSSAKASVAASYARAQVLAASTSSAMTSSVPTKSTAYAGFSAMTAAVMAGVRSATRHPADYLDRTTRESPSAVLRSRELDSVNGSLEDDDSDEARAGKRARRDRNETGSGNSTASGSTERGEETRGSSGLDESASR